MTDLRVDYCARDAAEWACRRWHYTGSLPTGKMVATGAWEDGEFIGVVLFSRGSSPYLQHSWDLDLTEVCEMTRVALGDHRSHTSAVVARALRLLKRANPGLRLVISFADPRMGHLGVLYQAGNWVYTGERPARWFRVCGELVHFRSVQSRYGTARLDLLREHVDPEAESVRMPGKHRYVYPLDRGMRKRVEPLAQPYPRPRGRSIGGDASGSQPEEVGSTPAGRSEATP